MGWLITEDFPGYAGVVENFVREQPVRNTVLVTVADTLRRRGGRAYGTAAPVLGYWTSASGVVAGAFLHTPPYSVLLGEMPAAAAEALVSRLAGRKVLGASGRLEIVEAFAARWARHTGADVEVRMRQRLYRLGGLVPPSPLPEGRARVATDADRELAVGWYRAFTREAGGPPGDFAAVIGDRLGFGGILLWEVDGTPVALAGRTRTIAGMSRVAPVYTPPEHRRHGYAAAVTAAVSRSVLDAGAAEVLLFTDLANTTSNALYQRVGYEPVDDYADYFFSPA